MKFFIIILIFLNGCASTTLNTDSGVSRQQLLLLPKFIAKSMAVDAYKEAIRNAEKNNKLNNDIIFRLLLLKEIFIINYLFKFICNLH